MLALNAIRSFNMLLNLIIPLSSLTMVRGFKSKLAFCSFYRYDQYITVLFPQNWCFVSVKVNNSIRLLVILVLGHHFKLDFSAMLSTYLVKVHQLFVFKDDFLFLESTTPVRLLK
jgi:hypothetical protein